MRGAFRKENYDILASPKPASVMQKNLVCDMHLIKRNGILGILFAAWLNIKTWCGTSGEKYIESSSVSCSTLVEGKGLFELDFKT
jgi:hypothetical protein